MSFNRHYLNVCLGAYRYVQFLRVIMEVPEIFDECLVISNPYNLDPVFPFHYTENNIPSIGISKRRYCLP